MTAEEIVDLLERFGHVVTGDQHDALELRAEGQSFAQIGETLNISKSAAHARVRGGEKNLRRALARDEARLERLAMAEQVRGGRHMEGVGLEDRPNVFPIETLRKRAR